MERNQPSYNLQQAIKSIVYSIHQCQMGRTAPLVVALDGGSGAGKSTLAAEAASRLVQLSSSVTTFLMQLLPTMNGIHSRWNKSVIVALIGSVCVMKHYYHY